MHSTTRTGFWGLVVTLVVLGACSFGKQDGKAPETQRLPSASIVDRIMRHVGNEGQHRDPRAETKERILADVSNLPSGPIDVTFLVRRDETLALYSEWSGKSVADIAASNQLVPTDSLKMMAPITLKLTADELDQFENLRRRYHESYEEEFFRSFKVVELIDYTITKGDNLWKLSRAKSGSIPYWLMDKVNPDVDFSRMVIGDVIKIPVLASQDEQTDLEPMVVDNLDDVAPGQVHDMEEGLTVQVRAGETLGLFAGCARLPTKRVAEVNNLRTDATLQLGQKVVLPIPDERVSEFYACRKAPARNEVIEKVSQPATDPPKVARKRQHTVASGENAWIIANKRYNITLPEFQRVNPGVNLERLSIGQKLNIP